MTQHYLDNWKQYITDDDYNYLIRYIEHIKHNKPFMICLNQTPETPLDNLNIIKEFLDSYFNDKSPFEV